MICQKKGRSTEFHQFCCRWVVIQRDRRQQASAKVIRNEAPPTLTPERCAMNGKGCDIGYALAVGSCERANSVETCTIAALDVITAFAVPNPDRFLAGAVGFFGSRCSSGCPVEQITQSTLD